MVTVVIRHPMIPTGGIDGEIWWRQRLGGSQPVGVCVVARTSDVTLRNGANSAGCEDGEELARVDCQIVDGSVAGVYLPLDMDLQHCLSLKLASSAAQARIIREAERLVDAALPDPREFVMAGDPMLTSERYERDPADHAGRSEV